jgi:AcrR family transcriptional regulator
MADTQQPVPSTRDMLIEATSRKLWSVDESELRILDICQETNLSTSVIYGHFRSRQGLIDASLLHLFAFVTDQIADNIATAARGADDTTSFVDALFALLTNPDLESSVAQPRQMFFRISATALSRPSIRPGFLELYHRFTDRVDAIYDDLVRRGYLGAELTGHQWALCFEAQMLSRAVHDVSSNWDNQVDWQRATHRILSAPIDQVAS